MNKKRFRFTHEEQDILQKISDNLKRKVNQVGFNEHFKLAKILGKGSFGNVKRIKFCLKLINFKVHLAESKFEKIKLAVKSTSKKEDDKSCVNFFNYYRRTLN